MSPDRSRRAMPHRRTDRHAGDAGARHRHDRRDGLARACSGSASRPSDRDQGEAVRLLYVHVPTIWIAYLAFIVTACRVGDVPVPQEALARLGSPRRRQRRDRRRLRRGHAGRRRAVGSPHLGRVLAVGRPPDHHRAAVRHLHRLPRRAPARRQPPAAGQAVGGDRPAGRPADPARPLERVGCGAACTRRRRCSTPTATSTWTA